MPELAGTRAPRTFATSHVAVFPTFSRRHQQPTYLLKDCPWRMSATMASPTSDPSQYQQPPQPQHQGLPSISSLTNGLPPPSSQQRSPDQQSIADSTRDSGTWPQPNAQSKRKSFMPSYRTTTWIRLATGAVISWLGSLQASDLALPTSNGC